MTTSTLREELPAIGLYTGYTKAASWTTNGSEGLPMVGGGIILRA